VVGLLAHHGRLLVRRRPEHGIWGGLWEIPGTIRGNGKTREETILEEFKEKLGISVRIQKSAAPLAHRFTHRKAKIYPYLLTQLGNRTQELPKTNARWARPTQLARLSFPVAHQKILRAYSLTMEGTMEG